MLKIFRIFYFLWFIATVIATCFIIGFEGIRLYDYFKGQYSQKSMLVYSIDFTSSSRRSSATVNGILNNEKIYFSLFDEDKAKINEYLEVIPSKEWEKLEYENLKKYNVIVPIIKFLNSNRAILINQNSSLKSTIQNWIYSKMIILSTMYIVLILLAFIKRKLR